MKYVAMFFSGVVVLVTAIFAWIAMWGHGTGYVVLFIAVGLGILGMIFGRFYAGSFLTSVLMLILPYIFVIGNYLANALSAGRNQYAQHLHFSRRVFIVPLVIYLLPIVLSFLGVRIGMQRWVPGIFLFVATFLFAFAAISVSGDQKFGSRYPKFPSSHFSFNLVANEDVHLLADVECIYRNTIDYWTFRNLEHNQCEETTIDILSKNPSISLPTTAYWRVDGIEEFRTMWPINRPDGGSSLSYPRDFDNIPKWKTEIPFEKIRNSKDVSFRWGTIEVVFGEAEFQAIRSVEETVERLKTQNTNN